MKSYIKHQFYKHFFPIPLLYYILKICSFITVYILFSNLNINVKTRHYFLFILIIYTYFCIFLYSTVSREFVEYMNTYSGLYRANFVLRARKENCAPPPPPKKKKKKKLNEKNDLLITKFITSSYK